MSLIKTRATKPTPTSPVGVGFKESNGRIFLTKLTDTSIFSGSKLAGGHEIISINENPVRGMTTAEIKAILGSIEGEIVVESRPTLSEPAELSFEIHKNGYEVVYEKPIMPDGLKDVGVTPSEWQMLVSSFTNELITAVRHSLKMDKLVANEMENFRSTQMAKGFVGFGSESGHERQVFRMHHQAGIQHTNLAMVASNVLVEANCILNPYRVKAKIGFTTKELVAFKAGQGGKNAVLIPTSLIFSSY